MKKIALACAAISFFFCYLEWGNNQSAFVYEAAYSVLFKPEGYESNFTHPLILLPFAGVLMLLVLLFQKEPRKRWAITGLLLPGILVLFILLVGALSRNVKIIASTVPFLASAGWGLWAFGGKVAAKT